MTVTATTRFGLPRWSAGTDPLTRAQIDGAMAAIEAEGASYGQGTIAARPAASAANGGLFYVVNNATGGGVLGACYYCDGSTWIYLNPRTVRIPHTFTVSGDVGLPSGSTNYIPPFFVPVPSGQSAKLVGVRTTLQSGTSATFSVRRGAYNGALVDVTGLTGQNALSSADQGTDITGLALSDGDKIAIVVTAVTGSPKNMTVTIYIDYTF